MVKFKNVVNKKAPAMMAALAACAKLSAQLGAGTASMWDHHQPSLPKRFKR